MRLAAALVLLLSCAVPARADAPLPSRDLKFPAFQILALEPMDFDLIDFREAQRHPPRVIADSEPHTIFVIKRHVGAAFGYDNGIVHTGVGVYLTVAELGRWNFGIPAVEFGLARYPTYDEKRRVALAKNEPTLLISLASVHYRIASIQSLGVTWYLNLEQVYDMRSNLAGSQFGFSFATK